MVQVGNGLPGGRPLVMKATSVCLTCAVVPPSASSFHDCDDRVGPRLLGLAKHQRRLTSKSAAAAPTSPAGERFGAARLNFDGQIGAAEVVQRHLSRRTRVPVTGGHRTQSTEVHWAGVNGLYGQQTGRRPAAKIPNEAWKMGRPKEHFISGRTNEVTSRSFRTS